MKILLVSTSAITTPAPAYSGLEMIVWYNAKEWAKLGHEVTLITTNESAELGVREGIDDNGKSTGGVLDVKAAGPSGWGINHERDMYMNYKDFMEQQYGDGQGVVIDHSWFGYPYLSLGGRRDFQLPNGQIIDIPPHPKLKLIHVIHGTTGLGGQKPQVLWPRLVGVSTRQAAYLHAQWGFPVRHVHNGIPIQPKPDPWPAPDDEYLLSLNRISKEKGIMESIDIAVANGYRIKVVGDYSWVADQSYVYEVMSRCDQSGGLAEFVGNVDNETKWDLIKHCKAGIACPDIRQNFVEAFGIYMCEINQMGKPMFVLQNGGAVDIIQHGVNGIMADTPEALKQQLAQINWAQFNPDTIRTMSERFNVPNMAAEYIKLADGVLRDDPSYRW